MEAFVKSHLILDWTDPEDQQIIQPKFEIFTKSLDQQVPGVLSIQVAPNGIVTNLTNIEHNHQALGHDILKDLNRRPQVLKSIRQRSTIVAGPLTLIQGGDALIARNAIFTESGAYNPQQYIAQNRAQPQDKWLKDIPSDFWGFSTVVIDHTQIFQEVGLNEADNRYKYSIKGKNGLGANGEVFWGDTSIFDDPLMTTTISLPTGEWIIGIQSKSCVSKWRSVWIAMLGVSVSGMLGYSRFAKKKTEEKLERSHKKLIYATQLKDEFLANMSHELRTPLNAILGTTEGLQEEIFGRINPQQTKQLQTIESSGSHLLSLINDILDVAKIEAGQMTLVLESSHLNSLIQSCLALVTPQAQKKNIQIKTSPINPNLNIRIDERRIRQSIVNLLNNAVKFTPQGGKINLDITISQTSTRANSHSLGSPCHLTIAVTDTGIGIAPEDLRKLFQPFIQIDSTLNRQYDGTGLGLALVKRFIELHSGEVTANSAVGQGSCFTIEVPCSIEPSSSPTPEPQIASPPPQVNHSLSGINTPKTSPLILLVEDNEANIITISSYLDAKGYDLLSTQNGKEAITLVHAEKPDLVLMDIQMPQMDGIETIQYLRKDPNLTDLPIIVLTALAMPGDRDRCLAAGATDYISKPIRLKILQSLIQKHLAG